MTGSVQREIERGRVCYRIDRSFGVRCDWSCHDKPGAFLGKSIVQESENLVFDDIGGVVASVTDWLCSVAGHDGLVVMVRVRVQQKLGAVESVGVGLVVVGDSVAVPELSGVVGVVAGFLHPHGQVIVIPTLGNDLLETAFSKVRVTSSEQFAWIVLTIRRRDVRHWYVLVGAWGIWHVMI